MTISNIVKIAQKTNTTALSKGQKLFNRLIKKIDVQRTQLQKLQTIIPLYQLTYSNEYLPLEKIFDQHRTDFVFLLDSQYSNKIFSRMDQQKLTDLILNIAGELLMSKNASPELKELYNRYADVDFDTQSEEAKADIKTMMSDMLGAEVDADFDINDPQSMLKAMVQQAHQMVEDEEALQQTENKKSKKTAKQLAKEAKIEKEEKDISESIRLVYRKLASALHPDRELDLEERTRKTDLMQRVNVAYDDRNLLQLLELQLEIEQIDETLVNTLGEDRLKHYNQILTEQLSELEMEIEQQWLLFQLRYHIDSKAKSAPDKLMPALKLDMDAMRADIEAIKLDLQEFKKPKTIKARLKNHYFSMPEPNFTIFDDAYF